MYRCCWTVALGVAFTAGFAANELVHRRTSVASSYVNTAPGEELCEAPPARLLPPMPVEEIDLTCREHAFGPQSTEPPLAGQSLGQIRTVSFELPAGTAEGPELPPVPPTMPYLTDDPAPGMLPPLGDVPDVEHPLFRAVKKHFDVGFPLDVTDKVPLGKPPVSEHPSAVPPPAQPRRADTTEVRPGDLPPLPSGGR